MKSLLNVDNNGLPHNKHGCNLQYTESVEDVKTLLINYLHPNMVATYNTKNHWRIKSVLHDVKIVGAT